MRIERVVENPLARLEYYAASLGGGAHLRTLVVAKAICAQLPDALSHLVVTGDLQGVVRSGGRTELLGHAVARTLVDAALVTPSTTGVVLTGDFFASPNADKRGASGDVRDVWRQFVRRFRWVAGVAGNHDRIGVRAADVDAFNGEIGGGLLDGRVIERDGLRVGGVSGIIGRAGRLWRRPENEFLEVVRWVGHDSDVLVLHEAPRIDELRRGSPGLADSLREYGPPLTVCGHCHWQQPLAALSAERQVLNVDGRVLVLTRA